MFDFNASHNDAAPVSPILFPVDLMEKSGLLIGSICVVSFGFTIQFELSECCVCFQSTTQ